MRRRDFLGALGAGLAGTAVPPWLAGAAESAPRARVVQRGAGTPGEVFVERWSWAMGQAVHLQLYAGSEAAGYEAATAALAELRRVEAALSRFDEASDLSELNRRAGRGRRPFGPDLVSVLASSVYFRASTRGAFDPAIEPLMRAWGFHAVRAVAPTRAEVLEARAAVRAATVEVRGRTVALGGVESRLDLGGIGVGYGLDRAGVVLRQSGVGRALLDVSGDCLAIGAPPGESGWLVEIAGLPGAATRLRDAALATSANTVSVLRWGRAIRGHVIDPATGYPAQALTQATVVARSGIEADALSTAMLVSGQEPPGALGSFRIPAGPSARG